MLKFANTRKIWLVTGSDRQKTLEQVGEELYNACKRVYQCNGNDLWIGNDNPFTSAWHLPDDAVDWLKTELENSRFAYKTGNHFDARPGLCNFSIVGRNATWLQREVYIEWDKTTDERKVIANIFNQKFPELVAQVAGETGLDIAPVGADKRQLAFDLEEPAMFFGDTIYEGGNDYPLAQLIEHRKVSNWKQTKEYLEILGDIY